MKHIYLDFEKQVAELDSQIEQLQNTQTETNLELMPEIKTLQKKSNQLLAHIYATLTPWQVTQVSRHPKRPYTLDLAVSIFDDFEELHGDRHFADDPSIVGGLASLDGINCVIIGHQKGRDLKERSFRNFGMPKPEGYRKALRLMRLAERFQLPIFTFIDTPGAYPGIDAEERGQSEAIGFNLYAMTNLKTPIIATVIGEGGSGGALAIAVADQVLMLENAVYSVISPEGCASILWKSAERASEAADALGLTAPRLKGLGLVDQIVPEPLGGAHRNIDEMYSTLKQHLIKAYQQTSCLSEEDLLQNRMNRLLSYGVYEDKSKQPSLPNIK
jgi:acetyl-CoA carboxylase carboxyl transferase subunit alpha